MTGQRTVAAFDFDGTLTYRDTLVPFLVRVRGRVSVARALAAASPLLLRAAAGMEPRQRAKEAVLIRTLNGWWLDELRPVAGDFARDLVEQGLRPDRMARLRWHQGQGHEVVLVSAGLDLVVAAAGRLLGCTDVLATQLEVDRHGRVTGRLFGDNVRGPVKVLRLREWFGADPPARMWAYGDSDGDTEMLAKTDVPVRLRARETLAPVPHPG